MSFGDNSTLTMCSLNHILHCFYAGIIKDTSSISAEPFTYFVSYFTPWLHIANYMRQGVEWANYTISFEKIFISNIFFDGSMYVPPWVVQCTPTAGHVQPPYAKTLPCTMLRPQLPHSYPQGRSSPALRCTPRHTWQINLPVVEINI